MNTLRPQYEQRTFYGPLELDANMPQRGDRHMMVHPDDPSKLVRLSSQELYYNQAELDEGVVAAQQTLDGLSRYGVNHVNPSYTAEVGDSGYPYVVMTVDRRDDAVPYSDLQEQGSLTVEQAYEADRAIGGMLDYVAEALQDEGHLATDMLLLSQFVYDDTQTVGSKAVLVDIGPPAGGGAVDRRQESMQNGYLQTPAWITARLVVEAVELARHTGMPPESFMHAAAAIEALPGTSEETHELKVRLLSALDSGVVHHDLHMLTLYRTDDEDEWE